MTPLRILVVDDERLIAETVAEVLSWEGHTCERAANGAEALERIALSKPDALVIDLMMPVVDGATAIAALRSNPVTAELPIVLMTAAPLAVSAACAYDALLSKPFDVKDLRAAVAKAVAARRR